MDRQSRLEHSRGMKVKPNLVAQYIAQIVKSRRAELGFSQEILADKAEIDRTYASQIERAIANPSLTVLCAIASALEISLNELIGKN